MIRIWHVFLCGCLLLGALSCTVIEEEDFEYKVDPTIGEGNIYSSDSDTDSSTETDSDTDSDTSTETTAGTDSNTDSGTD